MQALSYNADRRSGSAPGPPPLHYASPHAYSLPLSYQLPHHHPTALGAPFYSPPAQPWGVRHDSSWQGADQLHPWAGTAPYGYGPSSHTPPPCWQPAPPPLRHEQSGQLFMTGTETSELSRNLPNKPVQRTTEPISLPSNPRGPPSKPKHSDWAVWVGNLPPHSSVIHLKDHFATGATQDIQSVFLITKTGCAFVNYKSETACHEAIRRFDQQQFRGNRLVCRIRRNAANGKAGSIASAPSVSDVRSLESSSSEGSSSKEFLGRHDTPVLLQSEPSTKHDSSDDSVCKEHARRCDSPLIVQSDQHAKRSDSFSNEPVTPLVTDFDRLTISPKVKARFFILKSLTVQDLLVSSRDGAWMTQAHNEEKLNEAFAHSEDVYLIFSVNKSGEYFGYARMESPLVGVAPKPTSDTTSEGETPSPIEPRGQPDDSPAVLPTPATQTAPEGRIIDDSARGTIFWEAKDSNTLEGDGSGATNDDRSGNGTCEKHFAIRWMSTNRVPFHATRGMRNTLNHNREIKIARDGTEVDSRAAWRLLNLFNRRPDFKQHSSNYHAKR